ncbi:MAG TPA: hypothetical protein VK053_11985 [Jiangellaceae bacterium]|nr:hypothetical protein [Jiangellaceae bacterium]
MNLTQGLGYFMIPSQMWSAALDRYGAVGVLPSLVTDEGAAILAIVLIAGLVRFRAP